MIKPNMKLNRDAGVSYYSLVVAIAKQARQIATEAEIKGEILVEKPVDIAVEDFIRGSFKIVEPKECSGKSDDEHKANCNTEYGLENVLANETEYEEDRTTL